MIISLVAILMLLSDYTMEENEIDWFFQNGENKVNNDKFKAHFLGWKMGSASGKSKDKRKNKTTDPNEEMQITLIDFASSDQPFKSSPNWKTLILADSTIHYIPLEEMATVRNSDNSFIPEDAMDPFYLDIDPQDDMFNNELYNNQFFYKVPTEYPMHQLVPNPNMFPKKTSKSPRIYYPIGLSFHKKLMPLLDPYRRRAQHPMIYHVKPKIEPGYLPEINRHTMFVHPKLLEMMKAMDRSILSYPSKFEYKTLDQLRMYPKRLPPSRYNGRVIVK